MLTQKEREQIGAALDGMTYLSNGNSVVRDNALRELLNTYTRRQKKVVPWID